MIVVADFFSAVELRGNGLTLDSCVQLLPILEWLLDKGAKVEHIILASLNSIVGLCEAFGDLIRQTRAIITVGGVDLTREERLKKCNVCYSTLRRILSLSESIRKRYGKKSALVASTLDRMESLIHDM